jgi:CubicO group peptidase (beta-lactamase class C family)
MGRVRGRVRAASAGAACAAFVLLATVVPAAATTPPAPSWAAIDRFLADARAATRLPGMAVAITRGPEVVHLSGFGTDGRGGPVTPRTQFRIASLTKAFTAAAVLQLVAAGRIDLDAPVQTCMPGFATADPSASARITVRHLLNQTSGIADTGFPGVTDSDHDLEQRVASLRTARLVSRPGNRVPLLRPELSDARAADRGRERDALGGVPRRACVRPAGDDRDGRDGDRRAGRAAGT